MKKNFMISAAMLLVGAVMAFAQPQAGKERKQGPTPEQRAEFSANMMAEKLLLSDEQSAQFIPVYKAYTLELQQVMMQHRHKMQEPGRRSDSEIDANIRDDFNKSQEILNLRIAYYDKFVKVLNPRLVNEMYKVEKEQAQRAQFNRYSKMHGAMGGKGMGKGGINKSGQKK